MLTFEPDRGWSWLIVIACAYLNLAFFGLVRTSGVMYVAFLQNYGVTREEASWPFSICAAVFQLSGPVASTLVHYLSLRKTCIIGSVIATIGVACCYFANSIMWINIFYGVIHGAGFGLVVTVIPVIVSQYFVRYRTTAMGIAFSGGSLSSFVFPPALEYLLENYDLRGCFLLIGGVIMNTIVASSLLRAPPWLKKSRDKKITLPKAIPKLLSKETCESEVKTANLEERFEKPFEQLNYEPSSKENDDCALKKNGFSRETDAVENKKSNNGKCDNEVLMPLTSSDAECGISHENAEQRKNSYRFDINEKRESLPFLDTENQVAVITARSQSGLSVNDKNSRSRLLESLSVIYRNPMFYLLMMTINFFFLGMHSFFMVLVDFGKDKGILEQQIVYVLFAFSLTDLLGRLGFGWITDKSFIKAKNVLIFTLTVLGLLYQLYPIINQLRSIFIISTIHGLVIGSILPVIFVLQAEYIGIAKLPLALGLTSFINGLSTFFRPPLIGLFRDVIGSYNWLFHFIGALHFLLAILWFMEPWIKKIGRQKYLLDVQS